MKPLKFGHSDGRLDTSLTFDPPSLSSTRQQIPSSMTTKNSSWSAFLQYDDAATAAIASPHDDQPWYYGTISREMAEKHLKADHVERGDFLIRQSERKVSELNVQT
jgi:hypothetical protein